MSMKHVSSDNSGSSGSNSSITSEESTFSGNARDEGYLVLEIGDATKRALDEKLFLAEMRGLHNRLTDIEEGIKMLQQMSQQMLQHILQILREASIDGLTQQKVCEVQRDANQVLTRVNLDDFWLYEQGYVTRKNYIEVRDGRGEARSMYEKVPLQHPDAKFVAISKVPFGEGANRSAYHFLEVAGDRKTIVGHPLVAKESRIVLETANGLTENEARKEYVKTFIQTQLIARTLAAKFNDILKAHPRIHPDTPQISFLDCFIYELDDKNTGKSSIIIEKKLDHDKWNKFNSKNHRLDELKKSKNAGNSNSSLLYKNVGMNEIAHNLAALDIYIIEEVTKEESTILFTPTQVANAFCHFSFLQSDRNRLVCDLKGVYDESKNLLQLSDPVIHCERPRCIHLRTDRGREGIKDFFKVHSCEEQGYLCQLVTCGVCTVDADCRI